MAQATNRALDTTEGRLAALVIAVATVLWLAVQWFGKAVGLPPRFAFLADFAAIAAYLFALAQVWRIWRRRSGSPRN
ncbi:DUF5337 domain-containing protein [Sedimentimonas flavescens]|uniref:DUF5337 domain-containing protein n=1 Tax=Sedimentimonas flavescens TaxID=2851012 RepID=A0ABT2ZYB8_9RHOB|nr:DUF5337 domain-containing protein [Sedimentimonas flavescens]MCV2878752.1 DUF5337 domain-containing protein [Sedimentimonas flavescens]